MMMHKAVVRCIALYWIAQQYNLRWIAQQYILHFWPVATWSNCTSELAQKAQLWSDDAASICFMEIEQDCKTSIYIQCLFVRIIEMDICMFFIFSHPWSFLPFFSAFPCTLYQYHHCSLWSFWSNLIVPLLITFMLMIISSMITVLIVFMTLINKVTSYTFPIAPTYQ